MFWTGVLQGTLRVSVFRRNVMHALALAWMQRRSCKGISSMGRACSRAARQSHLELMCSVVVWHSTCSNSQPWSCSARHGRHSFRMLAVAVARFDDSSHGVGAWRRDKIRPV